MHSISGNERLGQCGYAGYMDGLEYVKHHDMLTYVPWGYLIHCYFKTFYDDIDYDDIMNDVRVPDQEQRNFCSHFY